MTTVFILPSYSIFFNEMFRHQLDALKWKWLLLGYSFLQISHRSSQNAIRLSRISEVIDRPLLPWFSAGKLTRTQSSLMDAEVVSAQKEAAFFCLQRLMLPESDSKLTPLFCSNIRAEIKTNKNLTVILFQDIWKMEYGNSVLNFEYLLLPGNSTIPSWWNSTECVQRDTLYT